MPVSTLQIFDQRVNLSLLLTILKSLKLDDVPMIRLLNFSRIRIQKISSKLQLNFSISKKAKNIASHFLLRKNIASRCLLRKNIALRCLLRKNLTSLSKHHQKSDFFFYYNLIILDSSKTQSEQKFHQYSACHQS